MRIDRVMDYVIEWMDENEDYTKSSRVYYRKHGHGVNLDRTTTPEEKHIVFEYHAESSANHAVFVITECMGWNAEQVCRMYATARALRKWYNRTRWERLPSEEMYNRIERFVLTGNMENVKRTESADIMEIWRIGKGI